MKVRTHSRAERILFVRRVHVLFLEEGDGERGLGVLVDAECLIAGLNDPTRTHLIPRRMSLKQTEKAPHLELPRFVRVGESVHSQVGHGFQQLSHLLLVQDEASAALARTHRAERLHVGAPVNVAVDAGPDRMSDSLVGLGLLRGHDGNGLDGLDGLHGLDCYFSLTFL